MVGERFGYDRDAAPTLGKAVAGSNVRAKGRSLGIFKLGEKAAAKEKKRKRDAEFAVEFMGRAISVVQTDAGVRATIKGKATAPESVERYLQGKFGDALADVRKAYGNTRAIAQAAGACGRGVFAVRKVSPRNPRWQRAGARRANSILTISIH